jgi:hypothetical protein
MKMKIRIDSQNEQHTRLTIFQDGGNTGQLCMNVEPAHMFIDALCENPYFIVEVDKSGLA